MVPAPLRKLVRAGTHLQDDMEVTGTLKTIGVQKKVRVGRRVTGSSAGRSRRKRTILLVPISPLPGPGEDTLLEATEEPLRVGPVKKQTDS